MSAQDTIKQLKEMGFAPYPNPKVKGVLVSSKFMETIRSAAIEGVADGLHNIQANKVEYPANHEVGMEVPVGGSNCAKCEYLKQKDPPICGESHYITAATKGKEAGSDKIPHPGDRYCCDFFEAAKHVEAATEVSLEGEQKGTLWNGVKITGFTGPEEEGLRAMMSRVPRELFFNVKEIKSAKELNAKHGRYIPETQIILFNPGNFTLRQRMGRGDGWMYHAETTVVHELGHAVYDSLSPEEKKSWLQLGNWKKGWSQGQASPYIERRPGWEHEISNWTHKAGLQLPRWYSSKNPNECFADCFAWYILNKKSTLDIAIQNYFDKYLKDHVKAYPSVSIE